MNTPLPQPFVHNKCLIQACRNLNIPYTILDECGNFFKLIINDTPHFFVNFNVPWNNSGVEKISRDKEYSYQLFHDSVRMPKSIAYFDPRYTDPEYAAYRKFKNIPEIVENICANFSFPLVIKMNSGSRAHNMFVCNTKPEITRALRCIYNKKNRYYDYVATAQDFIHIKHEYRVVLFRGEIMLMYRKNSARVTKVKTKAHAEIITDPKIISDTQKFLKPIYGISKIAYAGLDIAIDENNDMYLFELNVAPGFNYFVRHNNETPLINMFEKILRVITRN